MPASRGRLQGDHRRRLLGPAAAVTLVVAAVTADLAAAPAAPRDHPKPAAVPYRWQLLFEAGDLRLYTDPTDQQVYWYFTYKVTNRTGDVQLWAPKLSLFTDGGEILDAGRDVPNQVTEDILDLLGNPFLEDQNMIIGNIQHGRENAKEGLVVWPAREHDVNRVSIFVAGISGETVPVRNPLTGEIVVLRKTLQRDYIVRGRLLASTIDPIEFVEQRWIMR